ncbi:Long-chain-fatty-acid--CoA ligase [Bosea sp. 62]|uniref:AMP-binding protein n=1 Tax=unclassified Bosea (in: a-proteobacteria) TaxID=2653178 RepID=UPI001252774A|nr:MULTISPECIES: AMP-binding protein [unclassified Bosea (in: a-proteobacteria)]CAD5292346.1 Long-chain-fatty-acid--CoA ligase [Bosea sp. 7B]CAD5299176.1 Long-chain-fatty-acid--CoA ligase [Bosea sp. 21B]CAD5299307.1 Long-chain-fatty-acid--CoA ligase [Bosea sp. 46]VVT61621.1 Long-chain-fatty-acid--CoA ligase [Bosea sp. EC-HK365B]VXB07903.1 Long-chain-fatty-acid--CoA ligase [Bosea sp. 127]
MTVLSAAQATSDARPWLAHYPPAVPPVIDEAGVGTLADLIRNACDTYADRQAFESFGKSITFAEVGRAARAFAAWLQAQGFKKGDRIALMMPNILAYPATIFGALIGGFTVVNVNPLYTARELAHQVNDAEARALVVIENFAHVVEEARPNLKLDAILIATAGDLMGFKGTIVNFVARKIKKVVKPYNLPGAVPLKTIFAHPGTMSPVTVAPGDVAFLQYTGGTTGVSKGATLTHHNVASNVAQCALWLGWQLEAPHGRSDYQHVMVTALPLYHIFALTCCCMFMLRIGAKGLLIANPRDIAGFIKILKASRFTLFSGVNTLYNALASHPEIKDVNFSELSFAIAGGMATQAAVAKRWKEVTGRPIIEGYGLSETSPVASVNRTDITEFTGTIGYPLPSTDFAIRDAEGNDVPAGEAGEICIRGPQVMAGYWNRPDETAKVMTADGYFRSGDVGVFLPDGQIRVVDRMKDMVLVSGFNVYPNEVEDVLAKHPGVLESAVIGLPDEHSGEAVTAFVVKRDAAVTAEELRAFCKENLTGYKVPKQIIFRETLPKTNVGKVLRRALREEIAAQKG